LPGEAATYEYEQSEARMRRKSDIALYKKIEANRAVSQDQEDQSLFYYLIDFTWLQ
jgi:hypothetical protein